MTTGEYNVDYEYMVEELVKKNIGELKALMSNMNNAVAGVKVKENHFDHEFTDRDKALSESQSMSDHGEALVDDQNAGSYVRAAFGV